MQLNLAFRQRDADGEPIKLGYLELAPLLGLSSKRLVVNNPFPWCCQASVSLFQGFPSGTCHAVTLIVANASCAFHGCRVQTMLRQAMKAIPLAIDTEPVEAREHADYCCAACLHAWNWRMGSSTPGVHRPRVITGTAEMVTCCVVLCAGAVRG